MQAKKHAKHTQARHAAISHASHAAAPKRLYSKKFCPNCGRPITSGTLCSNCRTADFDFKDITIVLCNSCGSYFNKNKWTHFTKLEGALDATVKSASKAKLKVMGIKAAESGLDLEGEIPSYKAGIKKDVTLEVKHGHEIFDLPAKLEVTLCPRCSKKDTKYFESVLQLRNANDEIVSFVRREIAKQHSKGVFLNKESRIDKYSEKDIDFFLTNQSYAKVLAEKIRRNYGATIKKNAQLFSLNWQTSKNLYRLNILVQLPSYAKGDVIKTNSHLYKVISISQKVHVEDLRTGHKTSIANNEYDILKPSPMQIIKKFPEHEVLDPNTYYQARLMNPKGDLEINQKIKCVIDGSEAWMV